MRLTLQRVVWWLFLVSVLLLGAEIVGHLLGRPLRDLPLFNGLIHVWAVLLLAFHAWVMLGAVRAAGFVGLAMAVGFVAEVVSLHHSTLFGAHYRYHGGGPKWMGLPLAVPVFWALFIYLGYAMSSLLVVALRGEKPSRAGGGANWIPALAAVDGLIVVSIDVMLDPLMVHAGAWSWWNVGRAVHGIPLGNFLGWFLIAAFCSGVFRTVEYVRPARHRPVGLGMYLMPALHYAMLWGVLVSWAHRVALGQVAAAGTAMMGPILVVWLVVFARYRGARVQATVTAEPVVVPLRGDQ